MSHTTYDRNRLIRRLNRLIGQLEGVRRMVDSADVGDELVCYKVMQQLAAVRGGRARRDPGNDTERKEADR